MLVSFGNTPHSHDTGIVASWCPNCRALRIIQAQESKPVLLSLPFLIFYSVPYQLRYYCTQCNHQIHFAKGEEIHILDRQEQLEYPLRLLLKHSHPKLYEAIESSHVGPPSHQFVWDSSLNAPVDLNESFRNRLKIRLEASEPQSREKPKWKRLMEEVKSWDYLPNVFRYSLQEDIQTFFRDEKNRAFLDYIDRNLPSDFPRLPKVLAISFLFFPIFLMITAVALYHAEQQGSRIVWDECVLFLFYLWGFGPLIVVGLIAKYLKSKWVKKHLLPLREQFEFHPLLLTSYVRNPLKKRTPAFRNQTLLNMRFWNQSMGTYCVQDSFNLR